jgi:ribonuclease VapC
VPAQFVVDTSALFAIRRNEPERLHFHSLLTDGEAHISVATLTELTLVWQGRFGNSALADLDRTISTYGIAIEPVEAADYLFLRTALERFGRGRRSEPACLNFGDLFAYALARRLNLPILAKGDDFARTDVMLVL